MAPENKIPRTKLARSINALRLRLLKWWTYWTVGIWSDPRRNWRTNTIRTINLSVNSFLNADLQSRACAMAFRTMLALVPALALVFAIGRGFGFQEVLEEELFGLFPGQRSAIGEGLGFVDSYLNQASEGVFVGVGLLFLLWTLISLVGNVENVFNLVWGIRTGRSLWRKITDYTAMLLILPILMICASGLSIFVSSTLQKVFHFAFMTPVIAFVLKLVSWALTWVFFAAVYILIPNTKVRIRNALVAGIFAGTGFLLLQWAFVSGQVYVTRYNAIYGSFAFVPLLLIWLQLTWVVCLSGAVVCYASQNIFQFSFANEISAISPDYRQKVTVAITAVIVQRFADGLTPPTRHSISHDYGIPSRLVADITDRLIEAHIINQVALDTKEELYGFAPALEPRLITLGLLEQRLGNLGRSGFIPGFAKEFPGVEALTENGSCPSPDTPLTEINIQQH